MKKIGISRLMLRGLLLVAALVATVGFAFGHGGADRAQAQPQVPDAVYSISGSLTVKPLGLCSINGTLDVFLGPIAPVFGLDTQPHTLGGVVTVKCPSVHDSTFDLGGSGICEELFNGEPSVIEPLFNCSSSVSLSGTCGSIGEACNTAGPGLQISCLGVTDPGALSCSLTVDGLVNSKVSPATRDVNAAGSSIALTSVVGGIVALPEVAGTPLEAPDSSGTNTGLLAGTIAGIAALAVTLGGAAWYARRRWAR